MFWLPIPAPVPAMPPTPGMPPIPDIPPIPPIWAIICSKPCPPVPSSSDSSSSFHLLKSILSQCCFVFSLSNLSQYGPSSFFCKANSIARPLTEYFDLSGSTSFRSSILTAWSFLFGPPVPSKLIYCGFRSIFGFLQSSRQMVMKRIDDLCAHFTGGGGKRPANSLDLFLLAGIFFNIYV